MVLWPTYIASNTLPPWRAQAPLVCVVYKHYQSGFSTGVNCFLISSRQVKMATQRAFPYLRNRGYVSNQSAYSNRASLLRSVNNRSARLNRVDPDGCQCLCNLNIGRSVLKNIPALSFLCAVVVSVHYSLSVSQS